MLATSTIEEARLMRLSYDYLTMFIGPKYPHATHVEHAPDKSKRMPAFLITQIFNQTHSRRTRTA